MANGKDDVAERRESHIDLSTKINAIEMSIANGFSEMKMQHALFNKDLSNLTGQQSKVVECLYGNGHEGIVTKVAKISQRVAIIWAVLGGTLIVGLSILGYFVKGLADKVM